MKKSDIILFLSAISLGIIMIIATKFTASGGDTVIITKNGEIYSEHPLSQDAEINIDNTNTVKIENGYVYMKTALCPDHLCIHQGKIYDSSKKIICLPNRITVEVTKKSEIDKVVR